MGLLTLINYILMFYIFESDDLEVAQTTAFVSLTFLLLAHAYNCRRLSGSFIRKGFFRAYWLHLAVLIGGASIFLTIYIPFLRDDVFEQSIPTPLGWILAAASPFVFLILSEIYKLGKGRYRKRLRRKKENRNNNNNKNNNNGNELEKVIVVPQENTNRPTDQA